MTNVQTEARASLRIDEKWSVEYNPSNNNRPGRVLRYGEPVTGGSTDWKNDTFAMFYALLERDAALAAKDAELSDLQILLVSARQRAARAEAELRTIRRELDEAVSEISRTNDACDALVSRLAEANKALEAGDKLAAQTRSYQCGFSGTVPLGKALNAWDAAARRAREAQGGNNG